MARTNATVNKPLYYEIKFESVIRGHHVYKDIWTPVLAEVLIVKPDMTLAALNEDSNAMGVYTIIEEKLIGHIPMEFSKLLRDFFNHAQDNSIRAQVIGKRKKEMGLVVPAMYRLYTKDKTDARCLDKELIKYVEKNADCVNYTPAKELFKFPYKL